MILKGRVEQGKILLDVGHEFADGTEVEVVVTSQPHPRGTLRDLRELKIQFEEGYPGEFDDLMKMVREDKQASLRMEIERDDARDSL